MHPAAGRARACASRRRLTPDNVNGVGTASGCANVSVAGPFPGVSGPVNFAFTAPTQSGTYFIRGGYTTQFGCDGTVPGVTGTIGMIVVP